MGVQSEQAVKQGFIIKDSGQRQSFDSGMVRDTQAGKTLWSLVFDGPMLRRWAEHLTKGAVKYAARNWMKASGDEEYERFKESALRHFVQWFLGDEDEDHAAAVFFNINGAEYVKTQRMIEEIEVDNRECDGGSMYRALVRSNFEVESVPDHELPQTRHFGVIQTPDGALQRIREME